MKAKQIITHLALGALTFTAPALVFAGAIYDTKVETGATNSVETILWADGTTAGDDDFEFSFDFKYNAANWATADDKRQYIWAQFLKTTTTGTSGNLGGVSSDAMTWVEVVLVSSSDLRITLYNNSDGSSPTQIGTPYTFTYDTNWHRLAIDINGTNITVKLDGSSIISSSSFTNPGGEYLGISQRQRNNSGDVPTDLNMIRYDTFIIDGSPLLTFGTDLESPVTNTNSAWGFDSTTDSPFSLPVELDYFSVE